MTYVINEACIDVKDGDCTNVCPVDCIYEGGRMYYIQPEECVNCAICVVSRRQHGVLRGGRHGMGKPRRLRPGFPDGTRSPRGLQLATALTLTPIRM